MKRVFITGLGGFLGSHLAVYLRQYYQVVGSYYNTLPTVRGVQFYRCNIMKQKEVTRLISFIRPDVIIHAAGCKDVDFCDKHPMYAEDVNVGAAAFLYSMRNPRFHYIHLSSAFVFGGAQGTFHSEEQSPKAINIYSLSQRRAEDGVAECTQPWTILRLGQVYGISTLTKTSFIDPWVKKLVKKEPTDFVADGFFTPLYVEDLTPAVRYIIDNSRSGKLYHLAGSERLSPYAFALKLAKVMGYDADLVRPSTLERMNMTKKFGKDTSLSSERFASDFGYRPFSVENSLKRMKARLQSGWTDMRTIAIPVSAEDDESQDGGSEDSESSDLSF